MVGIVDIAPITKTVVIRGANIEVVGVSAKGIASLLSRFPALRALVTGRGNDEVIQEILALGGDVLVAIIAAGTGHPGDQAVEEAASRNLTLEEQLDVLVEIIKLTMPNGVGPLMEKLSSVGLGPSRRELDASATQEQT